MNTYLKDLLGRVSATFAFTFLSVFTVSDLSSAQGAALAGAAAAAELVRGALAKYIGSPENAGFHS